MAKGRRDYGGLDVDTYDRDMLTEAGLTFTHPVTVFHDSSVHSILVGMAHQLVAIIIIPATTRISDVWTLRNSQSIFMLSNKPDLRY